MINVFAYKTDKLASDMQVNNINSGCSSKYISVVAMKEKRSHDENSFYNERNKKKESKKSRSVRLYKKKEKRSDIYSYIIPLVASRVQTRYGSQIKSVAINT